jgi:hypothetical protein
MSWWLKAAEDQKALRAWGAAPRANGVTAGFVLEVPGLTIEGTAVHGSRALPAPSDSGFPRAARAGDTLQRDSHEPPARKISG